MQERDWPDCREAALCTGRIWRECHQLLEDEGRRRTDVNGDDRLSRTTKVDNGHRAARRYQPGGDEPVADLPCIGRRDVLPVEACPMDEFTAEATKDSAGNTAQYPVTGMSTSSFRGLYLHVDDSHPPPAATLALIPRTGR